MLSNSQFKVLDFNAAKKVKARTGRVAAIEVSNTPDNPALTKHEDVAMAIHDEPAKKENALVKAGKWLGLYPE